MIEYWDLDWRLRLGIRIWRWDWILGYEMGDLGLETGIRDCYSGCGFWIGKEDSDWALGVRNSGLGLGLEI